MLKKLKSEWQIARNLLSYMSIQATGQALAVVLPFAIAKVFSKTTFGHYSLCEMIIFLFLVLMATMRTPFIVHGSEERTKTGMMNNTFSIQCILVACCITSYIVFVIVFRRFILRFADITNSTLVCMSLGFLGMVLKEFVVSIFLATGQRKTSSLADLIFGAASFVLVGVFIILNRMTLSSVFIIYFLASLVVVFFLIPFSLNTKSLLPFKFDITNLKNTVNFNLWLGIGVVAVYIVNWSSLAILRKYASFEDIATYNLASKVFKGAQMLNAMIPMYFLPFISENISNPLAIKVYLKQKRPRIVAMIIVGFMVFMFIVPRLLEMLYPGKFMGAVPIARLLLVASVVSINSGLYAPILIAAKQYKISQIVSILLILVSLISNILLIPKYGLYGAAIAMIITQLYFSIAYEVLFRLVFKPQLCSRQETECHLNP
ncbi:MAG TPA: hypothetical protein DDW84_06120 [Phycisphaerales bacterium]|nr:MAG: hypothetical protein A2Y13_08415 [Planctomycetes bacterium GWC2_45_44]HBG78408.1 hypothetical protein [Phycisphaerales bacterium]HBR19691.1 hypothetical protein [Phycisphaerales bacterium]